MQEHFNLDTKVSDVLKIAGVGDIDPGSEVASGAVAWDGYVIVYKGMPAALNELVNVARNVERGGRLGGGGSSSHRVRRCDACCC